MSTLTAGVQGDPLRLFFQLSSCTCQQTVLGLPQTRVVLRNHEETCKLRCIDIYIYIYIRRANRRVTPRREIKSNQSQTTVHHK